jgi:hypothetical protein
VPSIDAAGLIPTEYATQIIQGAQQQSAVLALGKRKPSPAWRCSSSPGCSP